MIRLELERKCGTVFTLVFDYFWEPPDPDVGITGGWELEGVHCSDRGCRECECFEDFWDDVLSAIEGEVAE